MRTSLRLVCALCVVGVLIWSLLPTRAADNGVGTAAVTDPVSTLRAEIERLRAENEQLRTENQALRLLLADSPQSRAGIPSSPRMETPAAPQETGYWLTTASGIRHNVRCRYYKNSNGRPCAPNEGRACKLCGG